MTAESVATGEWAKAGTLYPSVAGVYLLDKVKAVRSWLPGNHLS